MRRQTAPRAYRELSTAREDVQRTVALLCIQYIQFVRNQFSRIAEHLDDGVIGELGEMNKCVDRGEDTTRLYLQILSQMRGDVTDTMKVAGILIATTNGFMSDRVEQLSHPAMQQEPLPLRLIQEPQICLISDAEALRRFQHLMDQAI